MNGTEQVVSALRGFYPQTDVTDCGDVVLIVPQPPIRNRGDTFGVCVYLTDDDREPRLYVAANWLETDGETVLINPVSRSGERPFPIPNGTEPLSVPERGFRWNKPFPTLSPETVLKIVQAVAPYLTCPDNVGLGI